MRLAIQKSVRRLGGTRLSWKLTELTDYIVIRENAAMHEALIQSTTRPNTHRRPQTRHDIIRGSKLKQTHLAIHYGQSSGAVRAAHTHLLTNQGFFGAWLRLGINIFTHFHTQLAADENVYLTA